LLLLFKAGKRDVVRTRARIVFPTLVATTLICASLSYGQENGAPGAAAAAIDAGLYTRYNTDIAHTTLNWNVCGSLPGSSGCYGSGSLGAFGQIGALLEGEPKTDRIANTVTRAIYVLDYKSGPNQNEVVLYVYTKVDTITTDDDIVTVTLSRTISLPLIGDFPAQTSMAANKRFLFIGTDLSPNAVLVDKRTFSVTEVVGFPPINLFAITTNPYGYVTLSFGSFSFVDTDFIVLDPNGNAVEDGTGSQFMLNTLQAVKVGNHAGITNPIGLPRSSSQRDLKDRFPAAPAAIIDGTLYTRYNMEPAHTSVNWNVCGSLPGSSGCYGSGSLGPFGRVGALLEGEPKTNLSANTVTRAIYILDTASGTEQNGVVLYVYTKVDTITDDSDTVTITLSQTIDLPLIGGTNPHSAQMAANKQFLFIGTDESPTALQINKRTFSITELGGFTPPLNVFGIFGDQYGYVTLSFGSFRTHNNDFIVVGPDGSVKEEGVVSQFMLNTINAVLLNP
jgi:hypothetical protein